MFQIKAGLNETQTGFDIVIGNPPYVDSENMIKKQSILRIEINNAYISAKGNWDLYIPFHELGIRLLKENGVKSFITPNKWLSIGYAEAFREYFSEYLYKICNCAKVKIFEAGVTPIVSFWKKSMASNNLIVDIVNVNYKIENANKIKREEVDKNSFGILLSDYSNILLKIKKIDGKFKDWLECENPFTTGEAYKLCEILIDDKKTDCFRLINTGTIDPYVSLWGIKQTSYLKGKYHFPQAKEEDLQRYFPKRLVQIKSSKLVITGMRYLECFYDDKGKYIAGKSTIIIRKISDDLFDFFCGLLNSKLISFYIKQSFSSLGIDGGVNFTKDMIEQLPIPDIPADLQQSISTAVKRIRLQKNKNIESNTIESEKKIDALIYELYEITDPKEIAIIEGQ